MSARLLALASLSLGCAGPPVSSDGAIDLVREATWCAADPAAWRIEAGELALTEASDAYAPPVRSPRRIALANVVAGDFDLTLDARQTSREYGHRDLCVVFGFVAPDRFYYAHLATTPDETACNVFLVDRAPRRRLAPIPAAGVDWGAPGEDAPWRRVRVERRLAARSIRVWVDGRLALEAEDATLGAGLVGLGSFDDTGRFRDVTLTAPGAERTALPFPALAAAR